MAQNTGADPDILVLVDESAVKKNNKKRLIEGFQSLGMSLDEKYGTLCFSGSLDIFSRLSDAVIEFINRYQINGQIFPVIKRETIDQVFMDQLLEYYVFKNFWQVETNRACLLSYDISHKGGRSSKRYHILQSVGALQIFKSCYWIPENRSNYIKEKFENLVQESRESNPNSNVEYHYTVIKCYPIGSPEGLRRWKNLQLSLFIEKIHSLEGRTRALKSYLSYVQTAWEMMNNEEAAKSFSRIKKATYWRGSAKRELEPFITAHLQRMRQLGMNTEEVEERVNTKSYALNGAEIRTETLVRENVEQALQKLDATLDEFNQEVHDFVFRIQSRSTTPSSDEEGQEGSILDQL